MKNVLKKISAIALAFTLLGTGTTVTKKIVPQFDNTITASAANINPTTCYHSTGRRITVHRIVTEIVPYLVTWTDWQQNANGVYERHEYAKWQYKSCSVLYFDFEDYCTKCGQVFGRGSYKVGEVDGGSC